MNVGISACLLGTCCTYDASHHFMDELSLLDDMNFIAVCPEVMGGLSIPRDPCEIVSQNPLKIISIKGEDKTYEYIHGSLKALQIFEENHVDVALLKYKSPSCSCDGIYDGTFSHHLIEGQGVFAYLCHQNGLTIFHEEQFDLFFEYIKKNRR